ncbi:MAG: hypothetical protein ABI601_07330 [bacterium]
MVGRSFNPELPPECTLPHSRTTRVAELARHAVILTAFVLPLSSCRDAFGGFGSGPRARTSIDQLFGALSERHADVVRNPKYEYARIQITHGALVPSGVFKDTAAWTGVSGDVRLLETHGAFADGRYQLASRSGVAAPRNPGDGRHVITLSRLSSNEYRWDAAVDFALGSVRPRDVSDVAARLIASAERQTERQARADLMASAPRTSAALGLAFALDSLHPTPLADGSTAVTIGIAMRSDLLTRRYPAFGDYMRRYVDPARFRVLISDRAGIPFIEATANDRLLMIRVRTLHGKLVALTGAPVAMPDTLVLLGDFKARIKRLGVGFHGLSMELIHHREGEEVNEWVVTAHKEPEWDLPFAAARLIRAPLRRPFSGEGSLFRLGLRGDGSGPTVLVRQSRLFVQESAILRFLNALSNTAMNDFEAQVEREENAWLRELFAAMREDARGAVTP